MKRGFTLIEILVVISILAIMGVVLTEIFIRSLHGSEKASILASIKQNGQAALETIDKTIRGANKIVCASSSTPSYLVVIKEGAYTRFRIKDRQIKVDMPILSGVQEQFIIDICSDLDYSSTSVSYLIDTNSKNGLTVKEGEFLRTISAGYKDTVRVRFMLVPLDNVFGIEPIEFRTTIELR